MAKTRVPHTGPTSPVVQYLRAHGLRPDSIMAEGATEVGYTDNRGEFHSWPANIDGRVVMDKLWDWSK